MKANLKHWRESASIIALARHNTQKAGNEANYQILFQKRSEKAGFMPSTIVFPGGTFDESDSANSWLDYFKSFNIPDDKFKVFQSSNMPISKIFEHDYDPNLRHIALRITAIRETFEEVGVLICKSRQEQPAHKKFTPASFKSNFDVHLWQKKVNENPQEFLTLCKHLDCYPDIWALHLWSNWLTPIKVSSRRFNAVFFLAFFESQPPVHIDDVEVKESWWATPKKVLDLFKSKKIVLPTPQWYEMSRLKPHTDIDSIHHYAKLRSQYGCELFFPIYQAATDGIVVVFPGDDLYPKSPDLYAKTELFSGEKSLEDLRKSSNIMHRMVYHDQYNIEMEIKSFTPKYCHVSAATNKLPLLNNKL